MIHAFQNIVSYLCFSVLAVIACVCAFEGFRQVGRWLRANLCPISLVVFATAAVIATCEAQKRGGEGGSGASAQPIVQSIPGAETNAKWRAHGAFEDVFYLSSSNWWARMSGGGWIDRLRIRSSGGIQAKGASGGSWTNYPPPFAQKFSLAPEANWSLPSLFWHATTPSNTLVMTWVGGLYARSHTNQVDFQVELFNDGSYDYRYADHAERFPASLPFDLDGDGLENSADPEPETAGPDAHGTNAEWYNMVCSNVLEAVAATSAALPPELSWRAGVNSNAYYFVDVVTERGPAPIYFTGDRETRLGNPVVVARAFETNRVPLLIGVDYSITSDTPFTVSFPVDYMYPEEETNELCRAHIRWPLEFTVTPDGNGGYFAEATPYDPGCTFVWGSGGLNGGLRSGTSSCDYSTSAGWICFNCAGNGDCGCHGCSVTGCAMLEYASFDIPSIWCGCWYEDPDPDPNSATNTPSSPPGGPSITLSLDENIVLFEAAYTNAPGESVDRHSTEVELTVEYDNPTEHSLTVILSVQSGQSCIRMRDASLGAHVSGWSYTCPSKTSGSNSFSIEGLKRSSGQGDVRLHGTIGFANDTACLTVVEVALTPERTTGDDLVHRHQFGVCERVWCESYPSGMGVTWQCNGNGSLVPSGAHYRHQVPFDAHNYVLTAEIGSLTLPLAVQSFFPACISVINDVDHPIAVMTNSIPPGEAGCIGMSLPLYCAPTNVSFAEIELREMETPASLFTQYFATTNWIGRRDHQGSAISADWFTPGTGNYFADDEAYLGYCEKPWLGGGSFEWQIPDICRPLSLPLSGTNTFQTTEQVFSLTAEGTARVMKFGYMVERMTNETINLWRPYAD